MKKVVLFIAILVNFFIGFTQEEFVPARMEYNTRSYSIFPGQIDTQTIKKDCMVMIQEEYVNERLGRLYLTIDEDGYMWSRMYLVSYKNVAVRGTRETGEQMYKLYDWTFFEEETGWVRIRYTKDKATIEIYDRLGLVMDNLLRTNMNIFINLLEHE